MQRACGLNDRGEMRAGSALWRELAAAPERGGRYEAVSGAPGAPMDTPGPGGHRTLAWAEYHQDLVVADLEGEARDLGCIGSLWE